MGFGVGEGARRIDLCEDPTGIEESARTDAVGKKADDLARVINPPGGCIGCAGHIKLGEDSTAVEKAVSAGTRLPLLFLNMHRFCSR